MENDNAYMTKMATSFLEELTEIEKQGFAPLRFLAGGARNIGKGLTQVGKPGGFLGAVGGKGAMRAGEAAGAKGALGNIGAHMKQIYGAGAKKVGKSGDPGGMLGGLGALGRSRYGQMAGAAAVPIAAGYGVSKLTS